jgi:hypothetical protein
MKRGLKEKTGEEHDYNYSRERTIPNEDETMASRLDVAAMQDCRAEISVPYHLD